MERFIAWYRNEAMALHPIERAARVHSDFVKIHPFVDGNGRISRLLMNLELMKAGYPAAVLPVEKRLAYYEALDADHAEGKREPFVALMADVIADSFKPYWHALGLPWAERT
ncbi:MAG: filamentation induced by cAMP protein Fic [Verrucomicrobiaceae bacterium]|nr:filamentation induced by cAMP protein Fic [Verrucomicrobiaceae bacterium]MDB6117516.1 filamentation induced by cAMP protein Fic [Verrucomicrobiaceae bacterium]